MKYALIGWNDTTNKRGAYTEAECLANHYNFNMNVFDGNSNIDMNEIRSSHDRVIFTYQNPNNLRDKKLLNSKYYNVDIQYIRYNIPTFYKYKTTNGFSVYLEHPLFINYIPMMIPIFDNKKTDYSNINLGYYIRPQYRPDDFKMFLLFLNNLKYDINLYVMGAFTYPFTEFKHVKKIIYTRDNNIFFDNITHYVYSESNVHDPYPTTLQEAVNCNKQIIMLKQNRNFKDGITDIENCIDYHTDLNINIYHDNTESILNKWNYDKFYNYIINNNFEYTFDRNKYNNIKDWLELW